MVTKVTRNRRIQDSRSWRHTLSQWTTQVTCSRAVRHTHTNEHTHTHTYTHTHAHTPSACKGRFRLHIVVGHLAGGAMYIRWGRRSCPLETDSDLVYAGLFNSFSFISILFAHEKFAPWIISNVRFTYSGIVGGTNTQSFGGGNEYLCLPRIPQWSRFTASGLGAAFIDLSVTVSSVIPFFIIRFFHWLIPSFLHPYFICWCICLLCLFTLHSNFTIKKWLKTRMMNLSYFTDSGDDARCSRSRRTHSRDQRLTARPWGPCPLPLRVPSSSPGSWRKPSSSPSPYTPGCPLSSSPRKPPPSSYSPGSWLAPSSGAVRVLPGDQRPLPPVHPPRPAHPPQSVHLWRGTIVGRAALQEGPSTV